MKRNLSLILAAVIAASLSTPSLAAGLSNEQLCTAGLALALDKQPRGIKTKSASGKRVLLSVKDWQSDWDYRCDVSRGNKTIKIEARDTRRNDSYLNQTIRYKVTDNARSIEVIMKKRKAGVKSETYKAYQLKS